jgi:O-antigen/teichoic acid export membrane protein
MAVMSGPEDAQAPQPSEDSPGSGPLAPRVLSGAAINLAGQLAALAAALLLTPLVVRGLGPDGYALYTLIGTFLGYLMMLTCGAGFATQRYGALYGGRGERGLLGAMLRFSVLLHLLAALVGGAALLFWRHGAADWIVSARVSVVESAAGVLLWTAVAAPFYFLLQCALNALYGLQRFRAYNALKALEAGLPLAAAAAVLALGGGLPRVAAAFAAVMAALAVLALALLRRELSGGAGPYASGERRAFLGFAGKSVFAQVFWLLMYQGDRLLIGGMLPLAELGFYSAASALARRFNILCCVVADTVLPMMAELEGRGERARLRRLYVKSTELSLFVILPLTVLLFMLIPQFLTLWLGADFGLRGTWPFRLLLLANLAYLATELPHYVALAAGAPELSGAMQGAKALLLVGLWPLLIPRWGIAGAAFGLLAAEWLVTPLFMRHVHRSLLDLRWGRYLREACLRPFLAAAALLAAVVLVRPLVSGWFSLVVVGAAGTAFYYGIGWKLIDESSRHAALEWLRARLARAK